MDIKQFFPKKSLGQNFLVDPHVREKIIAACDLKSTDCILEIGPGKGMLTRAIAPCVKRVWAVEADACLAERLREEFVGSAVEVIHADILKYPWDTLPQGLKVIGNLPYNISTPILEIIFQHREKVDYFYMTVQMEYGQRIIAGPHSKVYGSLSCFVQYYADVRKLFYIKNTAFAPRPRIQSCFMKGIPRRERPVKADNEEFLFRLIRMAFNQRRKTILNAVKGMDSRAALEELFRALKIDPRWRAEDIPLETYIRLANRISQDKS